MFYVDKDNVSNVRRALNQFDYEIGKTREYVAAIEWLKRNKRHICLLATNDSSRFDLSSEIIDLIIAEYQRLNANLENSIRIPVERSD